MDLRNFKTWVVLAACFVCMFGLRVQSNERTPESAGSLKETKSNQDVQKQNPSTQSPSIDSPSSPRERPLQLPQESSGDTQKDLLLPPSDLLFQSIQKELTVERPIQLEPVAEKITGVTKDRSKNELPGNVRAKSLPDRPWDAAESLIKGARQLEKRARKIASSDPAAAELLLDKSAAIREIISKILSLPPSETTRP